MVFEASRSEQGQSESRSVALDIYRIGKRSNSGEFGARAAGLVCSDARDQEKIRREIIYRDRSGLLGSIVVGNCGTVKVVIGQLSQSPPLAALVLLEEIGKDDLKDDTLPDWRFAPITLIIHAGLAGENFAGVVEKISGLCKPAKPTWVDLADPAVTDRESPEPAQAHILWPLGRRPGTDESVIAAAQDSPDAMAAQNWLAAPKIERLVADRAEKDTDEGRWGLIEEIIKKNEEIRKESKNEARPLEGLSVLIPLCEDWAFAPRKRYAVQSAPKNPRNEKVKIQSEENEGQSGEKKDPPKPDELTTTIGRFDRWFRSGRGKPAEILLLLEPKRSFDDLHEKLREKLREIGPKRDVPLKLLVNDRWSPLVEQYWSLSPPDRFDIIRHLEQAAAAPVHVSTSGRLAENAQQLAMQAAKNLAARDAAADPDSKVKEKISDIRKRLGGLIEHGFGVVRSEILDGHYDYGGADYDEGRRNLPWLDGKDVDGRRFNFVDEKDEPTQNKRFGPVKWFNKQYLVTSHDDVRKRIAESIANRIQVRLAQLILVYQLSWESVVLPDVTQFLDDATESNGRAAGELPLRRTRTERFARAHGAVSPKEILDEVEKWPNARKVPDKYNKNFLTKMIRSFGKFALKISGYSVTLLAFLGAVERAKSVKPDAGAAPAAPAAPAHQDVSLSLWELIQAFFSFFKDMHPFIIFLLVAAGGTALVSVLAIARGELRGVRDPFFQTLKDQTHDALQKAADRRLKAAKAIFTAAVERDIAELERQMMTSASSMAHQRRDRSAALVEQLEAAAKVFAERVKEAKKIEDKAEKERQNAQSKAVALLSKKLDLKPIKVG